MRSSTRLRATKLNAPLLSRPRGRVARATSRPPSPTPPHVDNHHAFCSPGRPFFILPCKPGPPPARPVSIDDHVLHPGQRPPSFFDQALQTFGPARWNPPTPKQAPSADRLHGEEARCERWIRAAPADGPHSISRLSKHSLPRGLAYNRRMNTRLAPIAASDILAWWIACACPGSARKGLAPPRLTEHRLYSAQHPIGHEHHDCPCRKPGDDDVDFFPKPPSPWRA